MGSKDRKKREVRRRGAISKVKLDLLVNESLGASIDEPVDAPMDGLLNTSMWLDEQGIHALIPGERPDAERLERMTREYQNRIRQSPMFDELVRTYGPVQAEAILQQCRAELR